MKEYVERALAVRELEVLRQEYEMHDDCDELVARRCRDAISALPAADVSQVRHGSWERNSPDDIEVYCSQCMMPQDAPSNYCPSCGALMDKENEHEAD